VRLLDSPAADNLAHDRIKREPVGVVDVLVSGNTTKNRLPEQPIKPMDRVLATPGVA
jgi:hypothetical protein